MNTDFAADALEIDPAAAFNRQRVGALMLDVREDDERAAGYASGSIGLPRAEIEQRIASLAPSHDREILAICAGGSRGRRAAKNIRGLG
jgi:rhodanese-related sulfurtransferase